MCDYINFVLNQWCRQMGACMHLIGSLIVLKPHIPWHAEYSYYNYTLSEHAAQSSVQVISFVINIMWWLIYFYIYIIQLFMVTYILYLRENIHKHVLRQKREHLLVGSTILHDDKDERCTCDYYSCCHLSNRDLYYTGSSSANKDKFWLGGPVESSTTEINRWSSLHSTRRVTLIWR